MPLQGNYEVERLNPKHQFGEKVSGQEKQAILKAQQLVVQFVAVMGDKANATNFTQWLGQQNSEDSKAVTALLESWKNVVPAQLKDMPYMVNYLNMETRQQYVIEPGIDGLLYSREPNQTTFKFTQKPFDTSMSQAAYGGRSHKAIWVQGPSGRFYSSNESKAGKFHHSSFLAGRQVKAAGDWEVDKGRLKTISAVSGHYHPPLVALRQALLDLKSTLRQILGWGAVVEVWKNKARTELPVEEVLDKSEKDKNYLQRFRAVQ